MIRLGKLDINNNDKTDTISDIFFRFFMIRNSFSRFYGDPIDTVRIKSMTKYYEGDIEEDHHWHIWFNVKSRNYFRDVGVSIPDIRYKLANKTIRDKNIFDKMSGLNIINTTCYEYDIFIDMDMDDFLLYKLAL